MNEVDHNSNRQRDTESQSEPATGRQSQSESSGAGEGHLFEGSARAAAASGRALTKSMKEVPYLQIAQLNIQAAMTTQSRRVLCVV